jgi:hypothetical protein
VACVAPSRSLSSPLLSPAAAAAFFFLRDGARRRGRSGCARRGTELGLRSGTCRGSSYSAYRGRDAVGTGASRFDQFKFLVCGASAWALKTGAGSPNVAQANPEETSPC